MATVTLRKYLKVFRFSLTLGAERIGNESARWEGSCLILTRALEQGPAEPFFARFVGAKPEVIITLLTDKGDRSRSWRIDYDKAVSRGPDFLNALEDDIAREAVCLTNARAVEITVAAEEGGTDG